MKYQKPTIPRNRRKGKTTSNIQHVQPDWLLGPKAPAGQWRDRSRPTPGASGPVGALRLVTVGRGGAGVAVVWTRCQDVGFLKRAPARMQSGASDKKDAGFNTSVQTHSSLQGRVGETWRHMKSELFPSSSGAAEHHGYISTTRKKSLTFLGRIKRHRSVLRFFSWHKLVVLNIWNLLLMPCWVIIEACSGPSQMVV